MKTPINPKPWDGDWSTKSFVLGCDHAGFETKEFLKEWLLASGAQVEDLGCHSSDSVDYPLVAQKLARQISARQDGVLGLLLCGSGNGVCMSANRVRGARAALCWLPELAALARSHNHANILCLPARFVDQDQVLAMVQAFAFTEFEGGRHQRRIDLIDPDPNGLSPA
ncbi:MAG: RpiB/LacA/LacB family sugar-phosphate isomerase [Bacteroidota bacterium]